MMNKIPTYYPGSSIVLMFRVRNRRSRAAVPLGDYDAEATIYTKLLGEKLYASSGGDPDKIRLERVNDYVVSATIAPEESARLPIGEVSVRLRLAHRTEGSVLIVTKTIFMLEETVKNGADGETN